MKDRKRTYDRRNINKLEEETVAFFKTNTERFSADLVQYKTTKKSSSRQRQQNPEEGKLIDKTIDDPRLSIKMDDEPLCEPKHIQKEQTT